MIQQFPRAFEFGEDLLLYLIDCVYSCQFGTFMETCHKERREYEKQTASVWSYVIDFKAEFVNSLYVLFDDYLPVQTQKEWLRIWSGYYLRHKCRFSLLKADKSIDN